jgi:hypothetical protein
VSFHFCCPTKILTSMKKQEQGKGYHERNIEFSFFGQAVVVE